MKKTVASVILFLTYLSFAFTIGTLSVENPGGVVNQPYFVRAITFPSAEEGKYTIGLEGHLGLGPINFSIGTFTKFPDFQFNENTYLGLGVNIDRFFISANTTTTINSLFDISAYSNPKIAFGLGKIKKTDNLFYSWSRFEFSYVANNLITKEDGIFKINKSFDWTNAQFDLIIESQDNGYFLFGFYSGKISELLNGNFKYSFELALPYYFVYFYISKGFAENWKLGLGLTPFFINTLVTYDFSTSKIAWNFSVQY
ncbi:MAG TPA: hypothetical protein PK390_02350 [Fervidobacterium nodosum]|nr:hypothetical protein [Fervidobacterium nodosum]